MNTLTKSKLTALLDEKFNVQGDTCLGDHKPGESGYLCMIDPNFQGNMLPMDKFSPTKRAEVEARRATTSPICEVGPCN